MVETEMIEYRLNGPSSQNRQRIRLMAALRENRFPQAILIDGPVGIGKKALAMPDGRYAGAYGAALLARERSEKA